MDLIPHFDTSKQRTKTLLPVLHSMDNKGPFAFFETARAHTKTCCFMRKLPRSRHGQEKHIDKHQLYKIEIDDVSSPTISCPAESKTSTRARHYQTTNLNFSLVS
eukprot:scaffold146717_cov64-Attheya_sp.AAC.3